MGFVEIKDCETKEYIRLNPNAVESYKNLGKLDYNCDIFLVTLKSGKKIHVSEFEFKKISNTINQIDEIFKSIELEEHQFENIQKIKVKATELLDVMDDVCPDDKELSIATMYLEEVVMWATKGVAHERDYGVDAVDWKVE